jgi:hypothetical protein
MTDQTIDLTGTAGWKLRNSGLRRLLAEVKANSALRLRQDELSAPRCRPGGELGNRGGPLYPQPLNGIISGTRQRTLVAAVLEDLAPRPAQ